MVLAWELIQGKIETLICIASTIIVVFALFKLRLSTNTDMILLFPLTHLPHARVYFYFYFFLKKNKCTFFTFSIKQYYNEETPEHSVQCVWLLHAVLVTVSHPVLYLKYLPVQFLHGWF